MFPLHNALSHHLPGIVLLFSSAASLAVLCYCLRRLDWTRLGQHRFTLHIFCLWSILLCLFNLGRTGLAEGLQLHLFALTAATLMMGWKISFLAAFLAQIMMSAAGFEPLALLGWNSLLYGLLPILCSHYFSRLLQILLPPNPFVFTLGGGFFGGILSLAATMLLSSLLLYAFGIYPPDIIWQKYLKFMLVIVYPEGFVNGVIVSGLVAFHPHVISAFDPDRYFQNKP